MGNKFDDELIRELQGELPITSRPYAVLADKLSCSEEQIRQGIASLHDRGLLRRVGAILRHRAAGFECNAMVAWKVNDDDCDRVGQILGSSEAVSHCYQRDVPGDFPYQVFSMVHARNNAELNDTILNLAEKTGIVDYEILASVKELKKTSVSFR
ncbi:MAG: Lrp/AsnC family transcriptional regulator [Candidatus Saccharibacteria bacterium]